MELPVIDPSVRGDGSRPVIYVDVPDPSTIGTEEGAWLNVARFDTKAAAVAWIRENVGHCDDDGNVCLITNG
jgi:hypothetical protein